MSLVAASTAAWREILGPGGQKVNHRLDQLTIGAIVGLVDLIEIRPASDCPPDPFVEGPFCWVVENPRPIEPVPFAGRLGQFEVPEHLIKVVS